jgi:hypothetical protein
MFGVLKGTFYYTKDYQHAKNEVFYVFGSGESVLDKVMHGMAHEGLKKIFNLPQISTYFERGNPCLNMKGMLQFLQMKYYPQKHWCDNIGWSIVITKSIKTTYYILIFCDEIKSVDNKSSIPCMSLRIGLKC